MSFGVSDPICGDASRLKPDERGGHPHIGDRVVKLKDTAINEVGAYQMASLIGVPVAGFRAFVLGEPIDTGDYRRKKGRSDCWSKL